MLEKDMYDSWKSIMELYMMNRQHRRMTLESVENGPIIWPTIEENGVTRPRKYSELSPTDGIQDDCDVKATNIILQGLPLEVYALVSNHKYAKDLWERIQLLMQETSLTKQESECKLYDEFDKFAYKKGKHYLKNASNPRKQATINDGRVTLQPVHERQIYFATGTTRTYTPGASGSKSGKQMTVICYNYSRITKGQATQTVITHNATHQTDDLNAYDFDCDELNTAKVALMANLSQYGSDVLAEVHNPNNMDNNMINQGVQAMPSSEQSSVVNHSETDITIINFTKINLDNKSVNDTLTAELERYKEVKGLKEAQNVENTYAITILDFEETLMLAEESRSKMILKQQDLMVLEKKVNTTPVDYAAPNQLSQDFEKWFVPQTELSVEQAFWSYNSMNSSDPSPSCTPTRVKVPKELLKVSIVNTSLKKLKHHLAGFDVVVKERTIATTITKGL
uniref:Integrase, catalytic region, zinc finger, CCHC-type, peptidase aspartic, catalytic n=1 Tax=Tanacetum cinerariifolium TaxID=118510 RepID=A0A6L2KEA4_TANCI|nr:hypothetical protein [Tanacetum cinerariifolium]